MSGSPDLDEGTVSKIDEMLVSVASIRDKVAQLVANPKVPKYTKDRLTEADYYLSNVEINMKNMKTRDD